MEKNKKKRKKKGREKRGKGKREKEGEKRKRKKEGGRLYLKGAPNVRDAPTARSAENLWVFVGR